VTATTAPDTRQTGAMSDDLITFVRARLDEDERIARKAGGVGWLRPEHPGENVAIFDSKGETVVYDEGWPTEGQQAHIVAHDPARVLAEVDAKRKTLDDCEGIIVGFHHEESKDFARDVLRNLALPHADHPDYREDWRP
jgi:hypothetical protein